MNKKLFLVSVFIIFTFIANVRADEYTLMLDDEAHREGLDTTTICVVQNDTVTIKWINGFPINGSFKKLGGAIVRVNYLNPSLQYETTTGTLPVSAMAIPKKRANSVDIMIMSGTGVLKMIDIKTGNVVLEEFIPTIAPEIQLECFPPDQRETAGLTLELYGGIPSGREAAYTVNYDHLPVSAYFMVISNQNEEVLLIKTIRKE